MPERIQLRRTAGWRKPAGAVVVSRGTEWGNPFRVGDRVSPHQEHQDGSIGPSGPAVTVTRELAVAMFAAYVTERNWLGQIKDELGGKDLACWCALVDAEGNPVPCHADVLLEIANAPR